jgi:F-type H+-transporting ATPase subunit epsilon
MSYRNPADEITHDAGPLHVVVVSPARPLFEGAAKAILAPGAAGSFGILPRHADLLAALGVGPLKITRPDGKEDRYAVWGGFLKVGGPKVTILVDRAVRADEVDKGNVKGELDAVLSDLRHPETDEQFDELLDRREWCQTRLKIAR